MTYDQLMNHAFTKAVLEAVRHVMKDEEDLRQRHGFKAEYIPDEYEFYLWRVGNRLAILLSHCEQLFHAIFFISNFRQTPSMARAGINRAKHLRYSIESYIIRTQTLYDLVLKLIDAVFNLMNADSQCRHATIVHNMKVNMTKIPDALKPLRKKLTEFEQARHAVIHRGGYQDEDLYRLELYSELENSYRRSGDDVPEEISFLPSARVQITQDLVMRRKSKYSRFNSRILELVADIFVILQDQFEKEKKRLRLITGRDVQL